MSPLPRILAALAAVFFVLVAGLALFWYLAYGVDDAPPGRLRLAALENPVTIGWGDEDEVAIQAESEADAWAALGYVHGRRRAWSVVLWRQAALGNLGQWFGAAAREVDELSLRLGLARQARASFDALSPEEKALLEAYAAGLNAALREPGQQLQQEFVLLDVRPAAWEAWHTLALERLFGWLAVSMPPEALVRTDAPTRTFFDADARLREWLGLHGFSNSVAWAVQDSAGTHFFQRHVYGATALPFFLDIGLRYEGQAVWGASLPGTPFFPAGRTETHAWALLLTGTASLERAAWDSSATKQRQQRLVYRDGSEHLSTFWHRPGRLALAAPEDTPDSLWTIRWAGLGTATDLSAWRRLVAGAPTPFTLLDGNGLRVLREGGWQVLGQPAVEEALPAGRFVGMNQWARFGAELLQTQEVGQVPLETWIGDAYSTWAAQTAPPLVEAAARQAPPDDPAFQEALTYLRNWDFSYDRASIAGSIFDTWMALYRDTTNTLPVVSAQDTVFAAPRLLATTLERALDRLSAAYGPDQSQWRWEHVQPARRLFPIWSVDTLRAAGVAASRRYEPVEFPGKGHPTALAWSPSPVQPGLPAPASWEAWLHTPSWDVLTVRYPRFDVNAPLGRYLISDRPPDPQPLPPPRGSRAITTLLPAN